MSQGDSRQVKQAEAMPFEVPPPQTICALPAPLRDRRETDDIDFTNSVGPVNSGTDLPAPASEGRHCRGSPLTVYTMASPTSTSTSQ